MLVRPKKIAPKSLAHIIEDLRPLAVRLADLILDPRNANDHDDRSIDEIAKSIDRYGQRKPIVVNHRSGIVEAGNGTVLAIKKLKRQYVAAVFVDDDPTTATGYSISDNRSAQFAKWNSQLLDELLSELAAGGVSSVDVGFTDEELDAIIDSGLRAAGVSGAGEEEHEGDDEEPAGGPERNGAYQIVIVCQGKDDQQQILAALQEQYPSHHLRAVVR